jgi:hypothetical protein
MSAGKAMDDTVRVTPMRARANVAHVLGARFSVGYEMVVLTEVWMEETAI